MHPKLRASRPGIQTRYLIGTGHVAGSPARVAMGGRGVLLEADRG